jgi:hypothetical protein
MKKSLTAIALLAGAVGVHAQGTVTFATYQFSWNIAVWSPQVATPTVGQQGNASTDLPVGSTVYTGVPLGGAGATAGTSPTSYGNGSDYTIGLYAVPGAGQTINLSSTSDLIATALFATTGGTGAANVVNGPNGGLAGSWGTAYQLLAITGTSAGGTATIQLAAWYNGGSADGFALTYAEAVASLDPAGSSAVANIGPLGGTPASGPPITPPDLVGITSFSLTQQVPEPSTIALGVIGASTFLMRLRRKQ